MRVPERLREALVVLGCGLIGTALAGLLVILCGVDSPLWGVALGAGIALGAVFAGLALLNETREKAQAERAKKRGKK